MRTSAILAVLLLASSHAMAVEDNGAYLAAAEITLAMDWAQTRDIVKRPNLYYETNPIIGQHPSMGRVNCYFAGAMVGTYVMSSVLGKYSKPFLAGITITELSVVAHNYRIGLGFSF